MTREMDKILSIKEKDNLMQNYIWETPEEINLKIADRLKNIRKRRRISQKKLSEISGVSYGSIKRFETTGQISLLSLTRIATALDVVNELREIFSQVPYKNIQETSYEKSTIN